MPPGPHCGDPAAMPDDRQPLVSIVMSMRDSAATIASALRSIQLQTLQNWETIVVDDGSSDDSAAIVSRFDDVRIRLVREPVSVGLAARLNQAIAISRGVFIARMDADDLCFPDRLERQVARLQHEPQLDVLSCGAVVFSDDGQLLGELPVGLVHEAITARPLHGFPFPHPTWCGRAEWFRNNPYDPKMVKTQDQDLLLRTYQRSRFAALDEVLVAYRQDELELSKMLLGRRMFMASIWREAQRSGRFLPAMQGIAMQAIKSGIDLATIGSGLGGFAQRRRLRSVRPSVPRRWEELHRLLAVPVEADTCAE